MVIFKYNSTDDVWFYSEQADRLQTLIETAWDFITPCSFVQTKECLLHTDIPLENHDVLLKLVQYSENRLAF